MNKHENNTMNKCLSQKSFKNNCPPIPNRLVFLATHL